MYSYMFGLRCKQDRCRRRTTDSCCDVNIQNRIYIYCIYEKHEVVLCPMYTIKEHSLSTRSGCILYIFRFLLFERRTDETAARNNGVYLSVCRAGGGREFSPDTLSPFEALRDESVGAVGSPTGPPDTPLRHAGTWTDL